MKLKQYLDKYGTPISAFARRAEISQVVVNDIVKEKKQDLYLSVALRIEDTTEGMVTCRELIPAKNLSGPRNYTKSNKKKKGEIKENKTEYTDETKAKN
jgi:DNA-binding transcriptional regulator YdaS (Cro superfamily)